MDKLLIKAIKREVNNSHLKNNFNFTYHTQKYSLEKILNGIFEVLKNGYVWRNLKGIYWNTIYKAFCKLNRINLFENVYTKLLNRYIKKTPSKKLKIQMTDTSFIRNKNGSDKMKRNKYMNNKKVMKLSLITDVNGIPFNVNIYDGNINDSKILQIQLKNNKMLLNKDILNKHSKYFLADAGYDSSIVRNNLKERNYIPLIAFNKRNTKDKNKLKIMTDTDKMIFKKRVKIEYFFGLIKRCYKRIDSRYDKSSSSYKFFLFMALCCRISKMI
jgi:hypothetical protein